MIYVNYRCLFFFLVFFFFTKLAYTLPRGYLNVFENTTSSAIRGFIATLSFLSNSVSIDNVFLFFKIADGGYPKHEPYAFLKKSRNVYQKNNTLHWEQNSFLSFDEL